MFFSSLFVKHKPRFSLDVFGSVEVIHLKNMSGANQYFLNLAEPVEGATRLKKQNKTTPQKNKAESAMAFEAAMQVCDSR